MRNDEQAVNAARVTLQNDIQQVAANGTTSTGLQGSQVAAAQAATQISQAQADQIRVEIAKATIVSPIDGVVVNRNLNPGEFPGTRQIFTLQETDRVYGVLNGSAAQITGLAPGATATIASSNLPGRQFPGTVEGVLNALNPGSTNFVVKVLLANPGGVLRPGMAVSAQRAAAEHIRHANSRHGVPRHDELDGANREQRRRADREGDDARRRRQERDRHRASRAGRRSSSTGNPGSSTARPSSLQQIAQR